VSGGGESVEAGKYREKLEPSIGGASRAIVPMHRPTGRRDGYSRPTVGDRQEHQSRSFGEMLSLQHDSRVWGMGDSEA